MTKSKKFELFGNILFGLFILIATVIFKQTTLPKAITKGIASVLFVLCGIYNLILVYTFHKLEKSWKAFFMVVGLFFAMLGDIVLIFNFILGAMLFAIGHIFFLVYFIMLQRFKWLDFIIFVVLITACLLVIYLYPYFEFNGLKPIVIAYTCIIASMLSKAIGNYITSRNAGNLISLIGASLFSFSDLMLLFNVFGVANSIFDYLCIYTYYPAEFLLAITVLLNHKKYGDKCKV